MILRFIVVRDDADQATIDKAIRLLSARKAGAELDEIRVKIQDDIDELLERRHLLTVTA